MTSINPLVEALKKTKQAIATDKVTKAMGELKQYWDELGLNHFEQVMDYTNCLLIYCEQLPHPEKSYIVVATEFSHYLAIDKFLLADNDSVVNGIHAKYLGFLSRYLGEEEIEYYKLCIKTWVASCHEEAVLKLSLPKMSIPAARFSMWADWRWVNIGMAPYMRMVMMINFPNEDLHSAIAQSSIMYISMQAALLNDIASVIKDKGSNEVNYYLEVAPDTIEKLEDMLEQSNKYLEMVDLSDNLKRVLRSAIHGSYLMYSLSKRYFGKTEPNW
ncbi:hypothetical protein BGX26_011385 [Mortierella sp. AD094]|nr:hypothetical protein BGX26_011385 [Mortierella sp. AD094]